MLNLDLKKNFLVSIESLFVQKILKEKNVFLSSIAAQKNFFLSRGGIPTKKKLAVFWCSLV